MAGRRRTGNGKREAAEGDGVPLVLRSDDVRFTSLLGGNVGVTDSGRIGAVDPAEEKANDPLE